MAVDFETTYVYQGIETELFTGEFKKLKYLEIPTDKVRDITVFGSDDPIKSLTIIRTLRDGNHIYPLGDIIPYTFFLTLLELSTNLPEIKSHRPASSQQVF